MRMTLVGALALATLGGALAAAPASAQYGYGYGSGGARFVVREEVRRPDTVRKVIRTNRYGDREVITRSSDGNRTVVRTDGVGNRTVVRTNRYGDRSVVKESSDYDDDAGYRRRNRDVESTGSVRVYRRY